MLEIPEDINNELEKIKENDIKAPQAADEEDKLTKIGNISDCTEIKKMFALLSITGKEFKDLMFSPDYSDPANQEKQAKLAIRQQNINYLIEDRLRDKFHKDKYTRFYLGKNWDIFTE